jgi:acyl-CoA dehydrogenase
LFALGGGFDLKGFFLDLDFLCAAAGFLEPLKAASKDLQAAATFFVERGMKNPDDALAGSTDFLHLFGHVCLGLMWARMAKAARAGGEDFHAAKLATGRYCMQRHMPATALHLARIRTGAEPVMALPAEAF